MQAQKMERSIPQSNQVKYTSTGFSKVPVFALNHTVHILQHYLQPFSGQLDVLQRDPQKILRQF